MSGGVHLHGLVPGQHNHKETSQQWWAVTDTVSDLIDPGFEPHTFLTDDNGFYNQS